MKHTILLLLSLLLTLKTAAQTDAVPVILTAGQSNADGRVPIDELPAYVCYQFCQWSYGSGDFRKATGAFEPFVPTVARPDLGSRWGFDAIVYYLLEQQWQRPFYVIKQTMGGTAIDPACESSTHGWYWSADSVTLAGSKSLLKAFCQQIDDCLAQLPKNYDIRCLLWHQGESDMSRQDRYYDNLKAVMAYIRQHLVTVTGKEKYARLPIICGTFAKDSRQRPPKVVEALNRMMREDSDFYVVDASDLTLLSDRIHFDADGAEKLGYRVCQKFNDIQPQAVTTFLHPWKGKRVAYFGDSITDPRNKAANKKYWGLLADWLDMESFVYGVSGRQWNDIPRQTDQLLKEHGQDVDAILVFMGTNDYNNGVPVGEWWDEQVAQVEYGHGQPKQMVTRRQRTPSMDPTTYRGRINIALDSLKRTFPTKQIVLLTPIHRADFHANEKNWQCDESYTNQCGEYLDVYVEAVKEAGNIWAVPVIDLNAVGGLFPLMDAHAPYFNNADTDRLHPNNLGHERLARTLYYQLLALPCTF